MAKKLLMLWNCTQATAEPDTMLEYTIHMDYCHPSIPKKVVIVWALMAEARIA
jgi:hypothetical protein